MKLLRSTSVCRYIAIPLLVIYFALGWFSASAQSENTLSEAEFWSLLDQTEQALARSGSAGDIPTDLQSRWAQVTEVRLDDGTLLSVDMAWLSAGLEQTDPAERQRIIDRVAALLDYHANQAIPGGTDNPLNALDQVLEDSRFQYPDVTPTAPASEPDEREELPDLPNIPQPGVGLSQIVLMVAGVAVVAFIVIYFARGLQIQSAATTETLEEDQDPETSLQAAELASTSETVRDYRAAVRYLYLSSLLLLDERGLIRYDRTLTNREHLQQIADKPQLLELLRPVVGTFDRVWYGFAPLDEMLYQEYRRNVERLRELAR